MENTSLVITGGLSDLKKIAIESNFPEVRAWLSEQLETYNSMVVTEDGIADAKKTIAKIRKVVQGIDSCRKEARAAALQTCEDFSDKCKELEAICKDTVTHIDEQVKQFELRVQQEKTEVLRKTYDDNFSAEEAEVLPWNRIWNQRWMNKGYSLNDAISDILTARDTVRNDLSMIRGMGSEFHAELMSVYRETGDIRAVMNKEAELRRIREQERAAGAAAYQRKPEPEPARTEPEPVYEAKSEPAPEPEQPVQNGVFQIDFRVWATSEQMMRLRAFLEANGIRYGKVQ